MQYTFVKACLLALAATTSVLAQTAGFDVLTAPAPEEVIKAGSTYTIKWVPSEPAGPISLILMQGATNITLDLADGFIAKSIDSSKGQYDWAVPADPTFATYGIKLQLDSDPTTFQYSNHFTIEGGSGGGSTTVHVSQVSTASTQSSTSASSVHSSSEKKTSTTSEQSQTTAPPETTAPSTTAAPPTTLDTSSVAPSVTPTSSPSATPSSPANSNAVVGGGLLGAMLMVFALL